MKKYIYLGLFLGLAACGSDDPSKNNKTTNNNTNNTNNVSNNDTNNATNNDTNNGTVNNTTGSNNDLCGLINCAAPPAPACDGTVAVTWTGTDACDPATGTCGGAMEVRTDCADTGEACDMGVCVAACDPNDPCLPPSDMCNGNDLVTYSGNGMCDAAVGMCEYAAVTVTTNCEDTQNVCQNAACVDLCATETCDAPAASCAADILTSYSGAGTCQFLDGTCDYAAVEITTDCALTNEICDVALGACVPVAPVAPAAGELTITEFLADPTEAGDGDGEWFEVYNNTNKSLILDGLTIQENDGSPAFTVSDPAAIVDPQSYFVFARNADPVVNGGVVVDYAYPSNWALSNGTDSIQIIDANSVVIDEIAYDNTYPFAPGFSIQFGAEYDFINDDNALVNFWCANPTPYGDGDYGTTGTADATCAGTASTIPDIQDPSSANTPAIGTMVELANVAITGLNGTPMFVQDAAGGAFSGIYVDASAVDVSALAVGDVVTVTGTYFEDRDNSMIHLFAILDSGNDVVTAPVVIASSDLADPATAEQWEGVLVQINEAGVTATLTFDEFRVDANAVVDDLLFDYANPVVCNYFPTIVGPLYHSFNNYKLVPRDLTDMPVPTLAPAETTIVASIAAGFVSREVCITPATTITWNNGDAAIPHTVHGRDPTVAAPNNLDLNTVYVANLAGGGTGSFSFPDAGSFHYRCQPHAAMEGVVIVTE